MNNNNVNNNGAAAAAAAPAPAPLPLPLPLRTVARVPVDVEISRQDALRACNPDIERPFASLEDACHRLLPFHVLADYDADDVNDKFLDSTGRVLSRSQLWNESLTAKISEFQATLQKQIDVFNSLSKKRADGEMCAEEGLMIEQFLYQDEKQKVMDIKVELQARERERAERDAEVRMKEAIAQAERARAEQARLQEAVRQAQVQGHHAARMLPQAGDAHILGEPYRFVGAAQMQEEHNNAVPESASPEQEGAVDDMLDGWDEDANESMNLLASHSGSEAGTLDLNSLTSTR